MASFGYGSQSPHSGITAIQDALVPFQDPASQIASAVASMEADAKKLRDMTPTGVQEPGVGQVAEAKGVGSVTVESPQATQGQAIGDLSSALMGMTPEQAERALQYQNTQTMRTKGLSDRVQFGEAIFDAIRGKQLRGQMAKDTSDADLKKRDAKYQDARAMLNSTYANTEAVDDATKDALARQYAMGEIDLKDLTPEQITALDIAKNKREIRAGEQTAHEGAVKIRNTFRTHSKKKMEGIDEIERQYEQFQLYEPDPTKATGAEQIGQLYTFVKALDPNSVVREGEVALVQQATNYMELISKELNKAGGGNQAVVESLYKEMYELSGKLLAVNRRQASAALAQDFNMVEGEGYSPSQTYGEERYNSVIEAMNTPLPEGITVAPKMDERDREALEESDDPLDQLEAEFN